MNQKENRKEEVEMVMTTKGGLGFVIVRYRKAAADDDEL